jgi:hypothetical protein
MKREAIYGRPGLSPEHSFSPITLISHQKKNRYYISVPGILSGRRACMPIMQ